MPSADAFAQILPTNAEIHLNLGVLYYKMGDDHYGIPYPGIFILDESMTIQGKLFLASYAQRVDASEVLALAKSLSL